MTTQLVWRKLATLQQFIRLAQMLSNFVRRVGGVFCEDLQTILGDEKATLLLVQRIQIVALRKNGIVAHITEQGDKIIVHTNIPPCEDVGDLKKNSEIQRVYADADEHNPMALIFVCFWGGRLATGEAREVNKVLTLPRKAIRKSDDDYYENGCLVLMYEAV